LSSPARASTKTARGRLSGPGRVGQQREDLPLELIAAVTEDVDRAARINQRGLRRRPLQRDSVAPLAAPIGPRVAVIEPDHVAQQQRVPTSA